MPCGGIYHVAVNEARPFHLPGAQSNCWTCTKPWRPTDDYVYFVDEWDCWIHRECIHKFLKTPEAELVFEHGHEIFVFSEEATEAKTEAKEEELSEFKLYRKRALQPMRPYIPGEDLTNVSVSPEDTPESGGMIARNPENPSDQWYVAREFFDANYEAVD